MSKQRIVAAANRLKSGLIVVGVRHCGSVMIKQAKAAGDTIKGSEQGFIDSRGEFLTRVEALAVAEKAGQLNVHRLKTFPKNMLFSEDLY